MKSIARTAPAYLVRTPYSYCYRYTGKTEASKRYAKGYRVDTLSREAVRKRGFQIS